MTEQQSPLWGAEWRLVAYVGPDGASVAVPDGILATAVFEDGVLAGSTGCNRYHAPCRIEGAALEIGPAAMTMMACDPERTTVEQAFTSALARVTGWARDGEALVLVDAGGAELLRLRAATRPALTGARWVATAVNNGRGAVASVVAGTHVTAVFGDDGRVTGSGGCNRFFGPYEVDGERLAIGPVASTRMACPEPEGVGEQEAAFFAALERVATWSIREDRLQLRAEDGALQVEFRPAGDDEG